MIFKLLYIALEVVKSCNCHKNEYSYNLKKIKKIFMELYRSQRQKRLKRFGGNSDL